MQTIYHIETIRDGEVLQGFKRGRRDWAAYTYTHRVSEVLEGYALMSQPAAYHSSVGHIKPEDLPSSHYTPHRTDQARRRHHAFPAPDLPGGQMRGSGVGLDRVRGDLGRHRPYRKRGRFRGWNRAVFRGHRPSRIRFQYMGWPQDRFRPPRGHSYRLRRTGRHPCHHHGADGNGRWETILSPPSRFSTLCQKGDEDDETQHRANFGGQTQVEPISEDSPAIGRLEKAFGDHTFYADPNGLHVLERQGAEKEHDNVVEVIQIAIWADEKKDALRPIEPRRTGAVLRLHMPDTSPSAT